MRIEQTNTLEQTTKQQTTKQQDMTEKQGIAAYMKEQPSNTIGEAGYFHKTRKISGVDESGAIQMSGATYGRPQNEEQKTVAKQLESSMNSNTKDHKNQMVVLASTMSSEDYQELEKQGFSLMESDSHTIVTVTDKIKTVLAKAGIDISAYGGDLDEKQIEEITGSKALASQIEQTLKAYDLPVDDEQMGAIEEAYEQLTSMSEISENAMGYLVQNEKEPTISNIYSAQYSINGSEMTSFDQMKDSYSELQPQIDQIIRESGLENNEETQNASKWLIANAIPLNQENLLYFTQLQELSSQLGINAEKDCPVQGWIVNAEVEAIAEGKQPGDAYLVSGYSLWSQAKEAKETIATASDQELSYCINQQLPLTIENLKAAQGSDVAVSEDTQLSLITSRRQLEETRLYMTVEANYSLLKRGITIDTKPLEALVADLKDQEQSYYGQLLQSEDTAAVDERAQVFSHTTSIIESVKWQPAYALTLQDAKESSLQTLYDKGQVVKAQFTKAEATYETLWTAPRADMGDSIHKAFQNVDDILRDLDLEVTKSNQRAVRILAYNQTEITEENIQTIKQADETVQRTLTNMTPAVTLEMIRKGLNPLDMDLTELNSKAEEIKDELGYDENERFNKYLWKLEQKKEISKEERDSYIGIYRLFAQVEKTDGAAIGSLVQQGADLTMRNLLSAVRSQRKGSMDYQVDDEFGGVTSKQKSARIDEQINAAFQINCAKDVKEQISPQMFDQESLKNWEDMTPEQIKDAMEALVEEVKQENQKLENQYATEELSQYKEVLGASQEVYDMLEQYDILYTALNLMAASRMMQRPNHMFRDLFGQDISVDGVTIADLKNQILESFEESNGSMEALAEAQENLGKIAENVMKTMINEKEGITSLDIKELRLLNQQFSICSQRTKEESYMIPMQTGDSVTGVSLKVIRGKEVSGLVDIMFRGEMMGKVAASFKAKEDGVSGLIVTDQQETRQLLEENKERLASHMNVEENASFEVHIAYVPDLDLNQYEKNSIERYQKEEPVREENADSQKVQTKRLYQIAEHFLQTMKEIAN